MFPGLAITTSVVRKMNAPLPREQGISCDTHQSIALAGVAIRTAKSVEKIRQNLNGPDAIRHGAGRLIKGYTARQRSP